MWPLGLSLGQVVGLRASADHPRMGQKVLQGPHRLFKALEPGDGSEIGDSTSPLGYGGRKGVRN